MQTGCNFLIIHTEHSLLEVLDQEKTKTLFNLIAHQQDIDKIHLK